MVETCELFSCTCVRIFFEKLGVRLDGVGEAKNLKSADDFELECPV
jgi:hypothetical protein